MGTTQSVDAGAPGYQQPGEGDSGYQGNGEEHPAGIPSALVICGPSGVGKGTLVKRLLAESDQFGFGVSHTTRSPRPGEQHGVHYYFISKEQFAKEAAEGKFLEYAEVHNNLYGTSIHTVETVLGSGKVCILDVDVQGARSIRKSGLRAIFVFLAPPSLEDLAKRLAGRGTETKEQIHQRLLEAKTEINSLNEQGLFDYLLINDDLEECLEELRRVAARAQAGLPAEPGRVPAKVVLEEAPLPDIPLPAARGSLESFPSTLAAAVPASASSVDISERASHVAAAAPSVLPPIPALPQTYVPNGVIPDLRPSPGMAKWAGKVALVTGASSGIGWAICEALAKEGMRVVAVARRKERLEKLQQHMHALGVTPSSFLPVVCDVAKDAEVATLPKIVVKRWPDCGVDVLVNNAGMSRNDGSLFTGSVTSWVEMLSTNVLGACMCTRAVLQDMMRRGSYGHIINMVGLSGHRVPDGPTGGGFYSGTKAALKMVTEGLRQEARGRGVPLRVTAISPGIVDSEFFAVRAYGDETAASKATASFPPLTPADVAATVVWCLSVPSNVEINDVVVRPAAQMV